MLTFSAKLNRLIELTGKSDLSMQKLAEQITEVTGVRITRGYMWEMCNDKVPNPRLDIIQALATFFEVQPSYFTDPSKDAINAARMEMLESMRKGDVKSLGLRASGLSAESLTRIARMIDNARELEGLEPAPGTEPEDP